MTATAIQSLPSFIIELVTVCENFKPYRYQHQVDAVNWLETQLSYSIFREFTQRWDNELITIDPILQLNSYGPDVLRLQQMLNQLGANLTVDGQFGSSTQRAVIDFQRRNQLNIDGFVGPLTWRKLRELLDPRYLWQMFEAYNPARNPHQDVALDWLQQQISSITLQEFTRRWQNS